MRRVAAVLCVAFAFAGSAAYAVAQNNGSGTDQAPVGPEVTFNSPPSVKDAALDRTIETAEANAPSGTEPGPEINSNQVHVPDEQVKNVFVDFCAEKLDGNADDPLCQAVILKEADRISGGVYLEQGIENRYERLVGEEVE